VLSDSKSLFDKSVAYWNFGFEQDWTREIRRKIAIVKNSAALGFSMAIAMLFWLAYASLYSE